MFVHFLFCFVSTFLSVTTLSTEGKQFIIACPWLKKDHICTAYITTVENHANIKITTIFKSSISDTQHFSVFRNNPLITEIDENPGEYDPHQPITTLPVKVFMSIRNIRVLVTSNDKSFASADAIVVMPKISCYKSYYTVTANGYPFVSIFSFHKNTNRVEVKFPHFHGTQKKFDIRCAASTNCAPGKTVIVWLFGQELWYFALDDESSRLNNVIINSEEPVYVVSGNVLGWAGRDDMSRDMCMTSLKPKQTWGKLYIVPNIDKSPKAFEFSTTVFPLTIKFHNNFEGVVNVVKYTLNSNQVEDYIFGETNSTLVVTADVPFGLYQVFLSTSSNSLRSNVALLNLIPVEQWMQGVTYIDEEISEMQDVKHFLIIQGTPADIIISNVQTTTYNWQSSTIVFNDKNYSVAEMNHRKRNSRIYFEKHTGRVMMYTIMYNVNPLMKSMASYPYDFYSGAIYQNKCLPSDISIPNDGKDNDCDGFIDEETKNGFDDDGDGTIDEDFVEPYSDGKWSSWTFACNQSCKGSSLAVKVRSCHSKSIYGKPCIGDAITCNNEACPKSCDSDRSITDCFCGAGCIACEHTLFECEGCRSGYQITKHCLKPCPTGWTGIGCTERKPKTVKKGSSFSIVRAIVAILAVLGLGATAYFTFLRTKEDEEEQEVFNMELNERQSRRTVPTQDGQSVKRQTFYSGSGSASDIKGSRNLKSEFSQFSDLSVSRSSYETEATSFQQKSSDS